MSSWVLIKLNQLFFGRIIKIVFTDHLNPLRFPSVLSQIPGFPLPKRQELETLEKENSMSLCSHHFFFYKFCREVYISVGY
jgi:hypothetical protein